jgi:hypothetical protein
MQAMQTLMVTSVTRHQQCFSMRNTKVKGRDNATPIMQGMIGVAWCLLREALKQGWRCVESWLWMRVCLLNIPRYIFIVQRLSILSKLDSNNPYRIWAEHYFRNLNYLIILDTWPIWPSRCPRRSWFTGWSYWSFEPILFTAHLLVWPSYGDNTLFFWLMWFHLYPTLTCLGLLLFCTCFFLAHVVSSLSYLNLLGNKIVGCWCCCPCGIQPKSVWNRAELENNVDLR